MIGIESETRFRLFGETRDNTALGGRLRLFPTFFTGDTQREVVTPLKRGTRTPARGPIDFEVVPAGGQGTFCLVYSPYPKGCDWHFNQLTEDLKAVGQSLQAMFLHYGFSAKKTSGWGVVADTLLEGNLWARGSMWPPTEKIYQEHRNIEFEAPDDVYRAGR